MINIARLWSSGFELNSTTANIEVSLFFNATISTSVVRSGTYALKVAPSSGQQYMRQSYSSTNLSADLYFRVYLYFSSFPSTTQNVIFLNNTSSSPLCEIQINNSGQLILFDSRNSTQVGSNSSALSLNTWYRIELRANTSTPSSTVLDARINGTSFASGTVSWLTGCAYLGIGNQSNTGTFTMYADDIAINDSTGSFQNSFPGDGSIVHLRPNTAGDNNAFTVNIGGTAGASNNYTRVNEVTPDDATSYNGDTVSGDIDDFNIDNTPSSIGSLDTINVVQIGVRYRAIVASGESPFVLRCKKTSGGTVSESSAITPNSTTWVTNANAAPNNYPLTLYNDPDGNSWTKAELDSAQIGYRISSTGTNATDISTVWMLVETTTASHPFRENHTSSSTGSSGTITTSFAVASNSNRLLLFRFGNHQGGSASNVQYNGVSLTKIIEQDGSFGENVSIWGLINPDTGTHNLTFTAPGNFTGFGIDSLYNCDTNLPSVSSGASGSSTTASVSITPGSNNNWILDVVEAEDALLVNSSQTQDFNATGQSFENVAGSTVSQYTAAAKTMSWSVASGQRWNIAAAAIVPFTSSPYTPHASFFPFFYP